MKVFTATTLFSFLLLLSSCSDKQEKETNSIPPINPSSKNTIVDSTKQVHISKKINSKITIDGKANEEDWQKATWYPINQRWLGNKYTSNDFKGQFKTCWSDSLLYVLAEIQDDTLIDIYPNPIENYWNDDCVEIFIDENNSDGNHQFNNNAFAYHIGLDYQVADLGPDSLVHLYNDHILSSRTKIENTYTWEFALKIYNDTYSTEKEKNQRVALHIDKTLGFSIAYCDNDTSKTRENFIGSSYVEGEDKDQGWINAGIFGDLLLKK